MAIESQNPEPIQRFVPEKLTRENIKQVLERTNDALERKSYSSFDLARHIKRYAKEALRMGEYSAAAEFYEQRFIAGTHMVMDKHDGKIKFDDPDTYVGGLIMWDSLRKADAIIIRHNSEIDLVVKTRIERFRGRFYENIKLPAQALAAYETGLAIFERESPDPITLANSLEFEALICSVLPKLGREDEAIEKIKATLERFEDSPEGKELKDVDPDRYAIWRSGLGIRAAEYFYNSQDPEKRSIARTCLEDAERTLSEPNLTREKMKRREKEVKDVRGKMSQGTNSE